LQPLQPIVHDLVLAGGGHAHVEVLRRLAMRPVPGLRVTLISRARNSIYSGMMPGHIAGRYDLDEISVNLDRLCVLGGHRLLVAEIEGLDPLASAFHLRGRPPVRFDTASVNVGVTPDLSAIPGAAEHATPVKPLEGFVRSFAASPERAGRLCIIGGGAGGVELALALSARFEGLSIDIVQSGVRLLPRFPASASRWATRQLTARGVRLHLGHPAQEVTASGVRTAEQFIEADQVLAVTPARAPDWLAQSGLRTDSGGFMTVDACLRSLSHPDIFGAGDCADYAAFPREKAGVFSVRAGPGLADNLRRAAQDRPTRPIRMQQRGLQLLGDGAGSALAVWGGISFGLGGRALFGLKDRIDQRWMETYNDFGAAMVARMEAEPESQRCAGCGGKVGPDVLQAQLGARSQAGDVAPLNDQEVASVDLLRDGFDDPFLFGKVAAVHALSDLHAAGATNPRLLAALTLPYARSVALSRDLEQVQAGLENAGVPVIGGHTAEGSELSAAVTVVGEAAATQAERTPEAGDSLILTKPLGVGLILAARMVGRVLPQDVQAAFEHCEQDNAAAAAALANFDIGLRTDVTGFGLLGHLLSSLPQGLGALIHTEALPLLTGARDAFDAGVRPSILSGNQRATAGHASPDLAESLSAMLHDPQTSGGLLFSLPVAEASAAVMALREAGYREAAEIGGLRDLLTAEAGLKVEVEGSWA
jgi:selenide,water dikinase